MYWAAADKKKHIRHLCYTNQK